VQLRSFRIDVAHEALRNGLHLKWVHADHERFELVNGGFHGSGEVVDGAFADPVDAFVGRDFCEEPVFPGVTGDVGVYGGDTHEWESIILSGRLIWPRQGWVNLAVGAG